MKRGLFRLVFVAVFLWLLLQYLPAAREFVEAPIELARGVAAGVELNGLRKALMAEKLALGRYPTPAEFPALVARNFQSRLKNPLYDSWGTPYFYRAAAGGFELRSGGPDRRPGTPDDLVLIQKES